MQSNLAIRIDCSHGSIDINGKFIPLAYFYVIGIRGVASVIRSQGPILRNARGSRESDAVLTGIVILRRRSRERRIRTKTIEIAGSRNIEINKVRTRIGSGPGHEHMVVESAVVGILVLVERKLTFVITDILNGTLAERGFNNSILVDCHFGRA